MRRWLTQKVHISWLVAAFFGGAIIGIAIAGLTSNLFFAGNSWLFAIGIVTIILLRGRSRYVLLGMLLVGVLLGLWRGSLQQSGLLQYKQFIGNTVIITGEVSEDITTGIGDRQKIRLAQVHIDGKELPGQVWLSTATELPIKRSDIMVVKGFAAEGFGTFAMTLQRSKIISVERPAYSDVARDVRDEFAAAVRKGISEPQASLGVGFLTGQRSTLPLELDEQLKIVGLTHVVVASGYNLTILVRFARRAFVKVSKYLATFAAGSMIAGFILVTGWSPSMSRAGLVAGLSLLAWYYGRTVHPVILLLFAAGVTALINPSFVWGDIGWYLSFAAFAGVIMFAPLLHEYFWGKDTKPGMLRQIFIDTSAAQIVTMPIMAFAFGQYSLYALPANLLVLWLIPFVMLLVFITGLAGLLIPGIVTIIGWPAQVILNYMTGVVGWISSLPGAQGAVSFKIWQLVGSYVVLFGTAYWLVRKTNHAFRTDTLIE